MELFSHHGSLLIIPFDKLDLALQSFQRVISLFFTAKQPSYDLLGIPSYYYYSWLLRNSQSSLSLRTAHQRKSKVQYLLLIEDFHIFSHEGF